MSTSLNSFIFPLILLLILPFWSGCDRSEVSQTVATPTKEPAPEHHHHHHTAPHGGTLVVFGEEFAHIELKLDNHTGKLTLWALDGEAENPLRLKSKTLSLQIRLDEKDQKSAESAAQENPFMLTLQGVANPLTGETLEETSQFEGQSPSLKEVKHFYGLFPSIELRGKTFEKVEFKFPEGNEEHPHEHDEEH
jgi:hypothetical protein